MPSAGLPAIRLCKQETTSLRSTGTGKALLRIAIKAVTWRHWMAAPIDRQQRMKGRRPAQPPCRTGKIKAAICRRRRPVPIR